MNQLNSTEKFIATKEIIGDLRNKLLNGVKVATFNVSLPVVYKENKKYYLAAFLSYYDGYSLKKGFLKRPSSWVLLDIKTGEIVKRYNTSETEFSDASYEIEYKIKSNYLEPVLDLYHTLYTFELLDSVRNELIETGNLNVDKYQKYMKNILTGISDSFKRFYIDLSINA